MTTLLALIAALTAAQFSTLWDRNIPVITVQSSRGNVAAIVDTGGVTELKARRPDDFATYYHGLPVESAMGADFLLTHAVRAGSADARGTPKMVPLHVQTAKRLTSAFVDCTIAGNRYRMLFDTAALSWRSSDAAHSTPYGVIFLRGDVFDQLRKANPAWPFEERAETIADDRGGFAQAASMVAPVTKCGGIIARNRLIVRRAGIATFAYMKKIFGEDVQGDASLSAFGARAVEIDFPHRVLRIW